MVAVVETVRKEVFFMLMFPVTPDVAKQLAADGNEQLLSVYLNLAFLQGYRTAIAEATEDTSELTKNGASMTEAFKAFEATAKTLYEENREAYNELFGDYVYGRKAPPPLDK